MSTRLISTHLPRRGLAEHRQFLLDQATAPYVLFLDDDLILEADVIARMLAVTEREQCGFVGCACIGLSFMNNVRPHQQAIEFWDGPVQPERVLPGTPQWERPHLHNAADVLHLHQRLHITAAEPRTYRVAWVATCVLFDTAKLRDVGGFQFWHELPTEHCGEDCAGAAPRHGVLPRLRRVAVQRLPPRSANHHYDRRVDAPQVLPIENERQVN